MCTVTINSDMFSQAEGLAETTLSRFAGRRGHYPNKRNSHLRGKLGEIGFAAWLQSHDIEFEPAFLDVGRLSECDVIVKGRVEHRCEIKTWDETGWDQWGRCVAVAQIGKLKREADLIVWCTTPKQMAANIQMNILGWSTIEDVENAEKRVTGPAHNQIHNYQLDQIRPLADFLAHIVSG